MIDQGTEEWFAQRCGKVTASRVADVIATTKSGVSASRKNYLAQLVAERLTGTVEAGYSSPAMQWGSEKEPEARALYAMLHTGDDVTKAPFVEHPDIGMTGASPDGYVGDLGLIEIKCPNTATHIETLLSQTVPAKYITQIQWQLACTGRDWCDFVSYDPRMPESLRMFVRRVPRDPEMIDRLEGEVRVFLTELEETVEQLRALV
jgi:putative phage-type endonuclease